MNGRVREAIPLIDGATRERPRRDRRIGYLQKKPCEREVRQPSRAILLSGILVPAMVPDVFELRSVRTSTEGRSAVRC
jgi:hypothetical protein